MDLKGSNSLTMWQPGICTPSSYNDSNLWHTTKPTSHYRWYGRDLNWNYTLRGNEKNEPSQITLLDETQSDILLNKLFRLHKGKINPCTPPTNIKPTTMKRGV